jgi:Putative peptidoglycan binding domain
VALADLRARHKTEVDRGGDPVAIFPRISIFGHADPVGDDVYNKALAGRRAQAIYGLLTRDVKLWETLYTTRIGGGGDAWGHDAINSMLVALGYSGSDAVRGFQQSEGLAADGDAGPKTRTKLFADYMDKLCGDLTLDKAADFLAGTDANGKGDVQGCGEFNPLLLFSETEEGEFAKPANAKKRNQENAPNRRVMVLLFRPGTQVTAEKWPCPRAAEGVAGCRKRFWSDGEKRRSTHLADQRRSFDQSKDTFACRFYDRLSQLSPCERVVRIEQLLIRVCDGEQKPIAGAPCRVLSGGTQRTTHADDEGFLSITATEERCDIEWTLPGREAESFPFRRSVFLTLGEGDAAHEKRLHNVGYSDAPTLENNVQAFQRDFGREETGLLSDIVDDLVNWHDGGALPERQKPNTPAPSTDPVVFDGEVPIEDPPQRDNI